MECWCLDAGDQHGKQICTIQPDNLACNSISSKFLLRQSLLEADCNEMYRKTVTLLSLQIKENLNTLYQKIQSLSSHKNHVATATKNAIPFNVWSFCGVKGCLVVLVVGHSFPLRLLLPSVFVPHIATAKSLTNKESQVLFSVLDPYIVMLVVS